MKKATKTIMALLTAMTMTAGAMGVTAYAEEMQTAAVAESVQTDGVFSQGAEYHFIKGSDALILDGEGSFTAEEFDEIARQFSPRAIVIGDNVEVPNNEWLQNISQLSSPYALYAHECSKAKESFDKMIDYLNFKLKSEVLDPTDVAIWANFQIVYLQDSLDFYDDFTYDQSIIDKGNEMEEYLINEKNIREDIARETISYYMYGLNDRIRNGIANPNGTENNQTTAEWVRHNCEYVACGEQDIIENTSNKKKLNSTLSKFLDENGIDYNENKYISLLFIRANKKGLTYSTNCIHYDDDMFYDPSIVNSIPETIYEEYVEETTTAVNKYSETNVSEKNIKGDVDGDGKVTSRDAAILAYKANIVGMLKGDANGDSITNVRDCALIASSIASGKAETLPDTADYNKDGKKNVRDAAAISKDLANK